MATSQLISFYASLTALVQLREINGTGSISPLTQTQTHKQPHVHTHTHTVAYSEGTEQFFQLNTLHNNLFANWLGVE